MSRTNDQIPIYAPDGTPLGYRSLESARRLLAGGFVTAARRRKGHVRAIFLRKENGGNAVEAQPRSGTRYSFPQHLDSGHHCWTHKKLDARNEDGTVVGTRGVFLQVLRECMVR